MIGPHPKGLGGISQVIRIWEKNGFFDYFKILFIPSVNYNMRFKELSTVKAFLKYLIRLLFLPKYVYVHTSSFNSFRRKIPFIASALIFKRKVILHIHPSHFYSYLVSIGLFERALAFYLIKKSGIIIVLSKNMKLKIKKLFPKNNLKVLPNAVDIENLRVEKKIQRKKHSLLYLGAYLKEKGIYELVDSIDSLSSKGFDVYLELCGNRDVKKLKQYVVKKKLTRNIQVNGWVGNDEKKLKLNCCTALVLPSHSEGIPNVILEAMATKTPIISTHVGGLKNILVDRKNAVIVKSNNPDDLSEKIELVIKDQKLRKKIAENGYNDVINNFNIQIIKEELQKIFDTGLCK